MPKIENRNWIDYLNKKLHHNAAKEQTRHHVKIKMILGVLISINALFPASVIGGKIKGQKAPEEEKYSESHQRQAKWDYKESLMEQKSDHLLRCLPFLPYRRTDPGANELSNQDTKNSLQNIKEQNIIKSETFETQKKNDQGRTQKNDNDIEEDVSYCPLLKHTQQHVIRDEISQNNEEIIQKQANFSSCGSLENYPFLKFIMNDKNIKNIQDFFQKSIDESDSTKNIEQFCTSERNKKYPKTRDTKNKEKKPKTYKTKIDKKNSSRKLQKIFQQNVVAKEKNRGLIVGDKRINILNEAIKKIQEKQDLKNSLDEIVSEFPPTFKDPHFIKALADKQMLDVFSALFSNLAQPTTPPMRNTASHQCPSLLSLCDPLKNCSVQKQETDQQHGGTQIFDDAQKEKEQKTEIDNSKNIEEKENKKGDLLKEDDLFQWSNMDVRFLADPHSEKAILEKKEEPIPEKVLTDTQKEQILELNQFPYFEKQQYDQYNDEDSFNFLGNNFGMMDENGGESDPHVTANDNYLS